MLEEEAGRSSKGHAFRLTDRTGRHVEVACISDSERSEWVKKIKTAVLAQGSDDPFIVIDHLPLHEIESIKSEPITEADGGYGQGESERILRGLAVRQKGNRKLVIRTLPYGYCIYEMVLITTSILGYMSNSHVLP